MTTELENLIDWANFIPRGASDDFLEMYKDRLNFDEILKKEEYKNVHNILKFRSKLSEDILKELIEEVEIESDEDYMVMWLTFKNDHYPSIAKRDDFPFNFDLVEHQFTDEQVYQMLPNIPEELIDEHLEFLVGLVKFNQHYRDNLKPIQVEKVMSTKSPNRNRILENMTIFQQIPIDTIWKYKDELNMEDVMMYQNLSYLQYLELASEYDLTGYNLYRSSVQIPINDLLNLSTLEDYYYEIARYGFTSETAKQLAKIVPSQPEYAELLSNVVIYHVLPDELILLNRDVIDPHLAFGTDYNRDAVWNIERLFPESFNDWLEDWWDEDDDWYDMDDYD